MFDKFIKGLVLLMSESPTHETKDIYEKVRNMDKHERTKKVIISMLTENTGKNIMDSGGEDNREWQKRRKIKNWNDLPNIYISGDEICKSLYHYLIENLSYDLESDKKFHQWCDSEENKNENYYVLMNTYCEDRCDNTYNSETHLDGGIQYCWLEKDLDKDVQRIVLQTHNGCDTRGGYSTPHVFKILDDPCTFVTEQTDIEISCDCGWSAYSDDGGSDWYSEDETEPHIEYFGKGVFLWSCPKCKQKLNYTGNGDT